MLWKLIHWFFEFSEKHLAPDTKDSIASWLLEAKAPEKVNTWIDTFPDVFDAVFGKRPFLAVFLAIGDCHEHWTGRGVGG